MDAGSFVANDELQTPNDQRSALNAPAGVRHCARTAVPAPGEEEVLVDHSRAQKR